MGYDHDDTFARKCKGELEAGTGHNITIDAARQFANARHKYDISVEVWGAFIRAYEGKRDRPTVPALTRMAGVGGRKRATHCRWCQGRQLWALHGGDGYLWDVWDWRQRQWLHCTSSRPDNHDRLNDSPATCPECHHDPLGKLSRCILTIPRDHWHDCVCTRDELPSIIASAAASSGKVVEPTTVDIQAANQWDQPRSTKPQQLEEWA